MRARDLLPLLLLIEACAEPRVPSPATPPSSTAERALATEAAPPPAEEEPTVELARATEPPAARVIAALGGATSIAATHEAICAVLPERGVRCVRPSEGAEPFTVELGEGALSGLASSDAAAGAIDGTGRVAWNMFELGARGPLRAVRDATAITIGVEHACAVTRRGAVWCWDIRATAPRPSRPAGVGDAVAVAAAAVSECAIGRDGSVTCWMTEERVQGCSDCGHMGVRPARVGALEGAAAIAGAADVFFALLSDGTIASWGSNELAGAPAARVEGVSGARRLAAWGDCASLRDWRCRHAACAIDASDVVWCWEGGAAASSAPRAVGALAGARELAVGDGFVCALSPESTVLCLDHGSP